jgi:hypothetical protein
MGLIYTFCCVLAVRIGFGQGVGIGTVGPEPSAQNSDYNTEVGYNVRLSTILSWVRALLTS